MADLRLFAFDPALLDGATVTLDSILEASAARLVYTASSSSSPGFTDFVYSFESATGSPFGGNATAGYTGEVGSITVSANGVEQYTITGIDTLPLATLLSATMPLDDIVFGNVDIITADDFLISGRALPLTGASGTVDRVLGDEVRDNDTLVLPGLRSDYTGTGSVDLLALRGEVGGLRYDADVSLVEILRFDDGDVSVADFLSGVVGAPPVAEDDTFTVIRGASLPGDASLFADNGSGPDSDPEGGALTVLSVSVGGATVAPFGAWSRPSSPRPGPGSCPSAIGCTPAER